MTEAVPSCPRCGAAKERRPSGRLICKPCERRRIAEWSKSNPDRARAIKKRSRDAHKAEAAEYRERNVERIRERKRRDYEVNRESVRARQRTYYESTREERQRVIRAWALAHPEHGPAYRRRHYAANRSVYILRARAYYAENREAITERWRQNPDIGRTNNQRRRAAKAQAICGHGPQCVDRKFLARIRTAGCTYCGEPAEHADHFIPLARGGEHCRENIVPACRSCNLSKNSRDPDEWLRNGRLAAP